MNSKAQAQIADPVLPALFAVIFISIMGYFGVNDWVSIGLCFAGLILILIGYVIIEDKKLREEVVFWILIILLIPLLILLTIYYWIMVNIIHKDLAELDEIDELDSLYY